MEKILEDISLFFPFWDELTREQREDLRASQTRTFKKGERITPFEDQCIGLLLLKKGQVRAFVLSDSGKEVTLYRLYELDICLFSASCIMSNIQFTIQLEFEQDTTAHLVPAPLYDRLMQQSVAVSNYTSRLMASRFSDVMWTLEEVLFKSMDCRLASALLEHSSAIEVPEGEDIELILTHEDLANDLGSAREVVTRMLKYLRNEGLIELSRGKIKLLDVAGLRKVADG